MPVAQVLEDGFGRIRQVVGQAVADLSADQLSFRIDGTANSIGWLVWHLSRVQDDHVADAAGVEQVWTSQGWSDRFDLPFDTASIGYGHSSAQVAAVLVSTPELLVNYHEAVCAQTLRYVRGLTDTDLDRVVDQSWDPPVTLGVRLVSVLSDDLQHAGQAAFVRGVLERA